MHPVKDRKRIGSKNIRVSIFTFNVDSLREWFSGYFIKVGVGCSSRILLAYGITGRRIIVTTTHNKLVVMF